MPLMFLTGDGMRGGPLHQHIAGATLIGERRTLPRYLFYSVRDEYPALRPFTEDGQPITGELYDVPMAQLHELLAREPPELELAIVELEQNELAFGMILRRGVDEHALTDITSYGGWRAYRGSSLPG